VEYSSKLQRIVEDFKSAIFSIVAAVSSSQTLKGQKTPKDTVQIFEFFNLKKASDYLVRSTPGIFRGV
jgi:uncharacterized protein (DUF302 family)